MMARRSTDASAHDRQFPHNLQAEQAILGTIIVRPELLDSLPPAFMPETFYRDAHQRVFRAMKALRARRVGIDLITLRDELARTGDLEPIGGPAYLASLCDGTPRSTNVEHYANIVTEHATRRAVMRLAERLLAEAQSGDPAVNVLASAQREVVALTADTVKDGAASASDLAHGAYARVEQWQASGRSGLTGLPTGFRDLDDLLGGLQTGDLILLAARPSEGKTSLALNIAQHVATDDKGSVVLVFSLEMTKEQLTDRWLSSEARVNSYKMRSGYLNENDYGKIAHALGKIANARLVVDDTSALPVEDVAPRARKVQMQCGRLDLIVIDYLQLHRTRERFSSRNEQVAHISQTLKATAKDLHVPMLVLSQLSRSVEQGKQSKPQLHHLRDSGSLEQDADVVLFIWRKDDDSAETDILVAKARNGPTGKVTLTFIKEETRFENFAQG